MPQTEEQYAVAADQLPTTRPEIPEPSFSPDSFFTQRNKHRKYLFWFSLLMSTASLLFLFVIISIQTHLKVKIDQDFEIISDTGMQIIAVAIFGQVFGVVYVIAHALWSNHEFDIIINRKK